jgi:hypothetical protein
MNERGCYGRPYIGAEPSQKSSRTVPAVGALISLGLLGAVALWLRRSLKAEDKAWGKEERMWKRSYPDLPYRLDDVTNEQLPKWMKAREVWDTQHPYSLTGKTPSRRAWK